MNPILKILRAILRLPGGLLILAVRFYQKAISPMLPPTCKYTPSCSQYFIEAVRKYGAVVGAARGCWRILRCNPFSRGGHDPP